MKIERKLCYAKPLAEAFAALQDGMKVTVNDSSVVNFRLGCQSFSAQRECEYQMRHLLLSRESWSSSTALDRQEPENGCYSHGLVTPLVQ
jgi:hypothetical protein